MLDRLSDLLERLRTVKDVLAWLPTVRAILPHARDAYDKAMAGDFGGAEDAAVAGLKLVLPAEYLDLIDKADAAFDANLAFYGAVRAKFFRASPAVPDGGGVLVGAARELTPLESLGRDVVELEASPILRPAAAAVVGAEPQSVENPMVVIALAGLVLNLLRFLRERKQAKGVPTLAAAFPDLAA